MTQIHFVNWIPQNKLRFFRMSAFKSPTDLILRGAKPFGFEVYIANKIICKNQLSVTQSEKKQLI